VGLEDGDPVGNAVVGWYVGDALGFLEGGDVGLKVGERSGLADGDVDGLAVGDGVMGALVTGDFVGFEVIGSSVGDFEGFFDGLGVNGCCEGAGVGCAVGARVDSLEGLLLGGAVREIALYLIRPENTRGE